MKTKFYLGAFAALALGLGFSSCSDKDEPMPEQNIEEQTPVGEPQYLSVRFKAGAPGSRATETDTPTSIAPVGDEATITKDNTRFYFFTADGAPYTMAVANVNGTVSYTNMVAPSEISETEGVLILGTPEHGYLGNDPAKVICVANASPEKFVALANKSIETLSSVTTDDRSWTREKPAFIMTSSTYVDENDNEIFWTEIEKLFKSADEAKQHPLHIYIERQAVKIFVTGLQTYDVMTKNEDNSTSIGTFDLADATGHSYKVNFKVELTGWRQMCVVPKTESFKNISAFIGIGKAPFDNWNIPGDHRSFWAYTPSYAGQLLNTTYDLYNTTNVNLGNYNSATNANAIYCWESTAYTDATPTTREKDATAVVVRGIVTDTDGHPMNMVYWAGTYYKLEDFKTIVANAYSTSSDNVITSANVELVEDKADYYNGEDGIPTYTPKSNTYVAKITVAGGASHIFVRFNNILWWKDGVTSYYATIQHRPGLTGVVRNHVYECALNGVIGLGVPGNTRKDPEPENETWLAAQIHVLDWQIVKNNITLE